MPRRIEVCPAEELGPGERRVVAVEGLPHEVGVFNVDGAYHALANVCPHHLAPLCTGKITGQMTAERVGEYNFTREGEVIQCPWHGWQFNIADGTSVFNPHTLRTRTYETAVETGADDLTEAERQQLEDYGTSLQGDPPPIDTYEVSVERDVVVVYV